MTSYGQVGVRGVRVLDDDVAKGMRADKLRNTLAERKFARKTGIKPGFESMYTKDLDPLRPANFRLDASREKGMYVQKGMLRQSVMPTIARVNPTRSTRRIVTGDAQNARRIIGKSEYYWDDVEKAWNPLPALKSFGSRTMGQARGLGQRAQGAWGGMKAGFAGVKPGSVLPSSRTASVGGAVAQGERIGMAGQKAYGSAMARPAWQRYGAVGAAGAGGGYAFGKGWRESEKVPLIARKLKGVMDDPITVQNATGTGTHTFFPHSSKQADELRQAQRRQRRDAKVAGGGAAGGFLVGSVSGAKAQRNEDRKKVTTSKRSYDPEGERRFRQGAAATGLAVGGGVLGTSGLRGIRRETAELRSAANRLDNPRPVAEFTPRQRAFVDDPTGRKYRTGANKGKPRKVEVKPSAVHQAEDQLKLAQNQKQRAHVDSQQKLLREVRNKPGSLVSRRQGSKVAGGVALIGGAGAILRNRNEERWD